MYGKLLLSCAIEAIANKNKTSYEHRDIKAFLKDLENADLKRHKAPGKGEHLIIEGLLQKGMALALDEKIVHLYSFRR